MAEKIQGPDLSAGIYIDFLKDREILLGHVGEESAVLIRRGDEFFAVGARCTHYGGPLEKGLVTDGEIHCPWHHAVFSIETGEVLKAPALNPILAWHTEVRDEKVFVTDKKEWVPQRRKGTETQQFVIIGSGAAGVSAAVTLRRQGFLGCITIISEDKSLPYDRPNLSKDFLAGNAPEEWLPLWSPEFYEENRIRFELGTRAEKLDSHRKAVRLSNGKTYRYDKCLLATGGTPNVPPIPGIENDHVYLLRSLHDCRRIIARTSWSSRVLILGAGFIGLEAAASLRQRNMDVLVVAPEEMPLLRQLGVHVGSFIKRLHEDQGVEFHLGHTIKEIRERSVVLDDGSSLGCDFVLVGAGIHPNTGLAEQAGCRVDKGVFVDEYLQTSVPDLFAAGDIAIWPDPRLGRHIRVEHWEVAERQGQVAALNMLGDHVKYEEVPFFWTSHYGVTLGYVGFSDNFDRMEVMGDVTKQNFAVAYYEDEQIVSLLTVGRDRESLLVEDAMVHFDQKRVNKLLSHYANEPTPPPEEQSGSDLPW